MTDDTSLHALARLRERCSEAPVNDLDGVADLCGLAARVARGTGARVLLGDGPDAYVLAESVRAVAAEAIGPSLDTRTVRAGVRVAGTAFATLVVDGSPATSEDEVAVSLVADAVGRLLDLEVARDRVFDLTEQVAVAERTLVEAAGNLVHDVNNPLAAAAMSLEIARDEVDDGLVAQLLDRAVNSTTRMKRMVLDLLAFSARPRPGAAVLDEVIIPLLEVWEQTSPGAVTVEGGHTRVPMSPGDLELVLVALLENTAKFVADDVPVRVHVSAGHDDALVRLEVADAGRGIDPVDRERVFTPTLRLDRKVPGTGLGLSTVRRLVRATGGEVALVDSEFGGVAVRITWPQVPPGAAT